MALSNRRELLTELLRGPMALAAAGVIANAFNLLMNLVLARALDPAGYGAVVVQTNVFMILSVGGTAVLTAVVHRESARIGETRRERWAWIRRLRGVTGLGIVIASVASVALCKPAALVLSYPHPFAIAEASIAASIWVALCIERGLLQARGNYPALARNLVFESACRITCVIAFVGGGHLGVNGAGLALVLGTAAGAEHARWAVARTPALPPLRRIVPPRMALQGGVTVTATGPIPVLPRQPRIRDNLIADTSTALGALIPLALLQNMDVVIVGWRNPAHVGSYAAISTACKVPVFIGLAVANFLLPEAARRRKEGLPAGRALAMAIGFVVAPGLALAAIGAVAAKPLLSLVFGPELTADAPALWVLALAMTYLAISLMFTTYLLGANHRRIVPALAGCTIVTGVGLTLAGGGYMRTAATGLGCQAVTAAVAGALVYQLHHSDRARAAESAAADLAAGRDPLAAIDQLGVNDVAEGAAPAGAWPEAVPARTHADPRASRGPRAGSDADSGPGAGAGRSADTGASRVAFASLSADVATAVISDSTLEPRTAEYAATAPTGRGTGEDVAVPADADEARGAEAAVDEDDAADRVDFAAAGDDGAGDDGAGDDDGAAGPTRPGDDHAVETAERSERADRPRRIERAGSGAAAGGAEIREHPGSPGRREISGRAGGRESRQELASPAERGPAPRAATR
jgi:O-antigen/teichoic acid export membrane protein